MFDIGFPEMIVILVIAFLVLGPERIPGAARTLGRFIGQLRQLSGDVTDPIQEIRAAVQEGIHEGEVLAQQLQEVQAEATEVGEELSQELQEVQAEAASVVTGGEAAAEEPEVSAEEPEASAAPTEAPPQWDERYREQFLADLAASKTTDAEAPSVARAAAASSDAASEERDAESPPPAVAGAVPTDDPVESPESATAADGTAEIGPDAEVLPDVEMRAADPSAETIPLSESDEAASALVTSGDTAPAIPEPGDADGEGALATSPVAVAADGGQTKSEETNAVPTADEEPGTTDEEASAAPAADVEPGGTGEADSLSEPAQLAVPPASTADSGPPISADVDGAVTATVKPGAPERAASAATTVSDDPSAVDGTAVDVPAGESEAPSPAIIPKPPAPPQSVSVVQARPDPEATDPVTDTQMPTHREVPSGEGTRIELPTSLYEALEGMDIPPEARAHELIVLGLYREGRMTAARAAWQLGMTEDEFTALLVSKGETVA